MEDRIRYLEELVVAQMKASSSSRIAGGHPNEISPSALANSAGCFSVDGSESSYVDGTHWTAIIDSIADLREILTNGGESITVDTQHRSRLEQPDLVLGGHFPADERAEILAALPTKPVADRLVAKFFSAVEIASLLIHGPTFLGDYEAFWVDHTGSSIIWIGLLFAMMCLAKQYVPAEEGGNDMLPSEIWTLREKVIHCLVHGDYVRTGPYVIETLLLYLHIEYLIVQDAHNRPWVVFGTIARLALRMGYHRDPTVFSRQHHTPLQIEMRRRVWIVIRMMDVVVATQFGLPRMLNDIYSDAAEPRNLLDEDLQGSMANLPPSRPESVQTAVQYYVTKNRIVAVFGRIFDMVLRKETTAPLTYAEILRLDVELGEAHDRVPEWLRMRPMSASIITDPGTILYRMYIDIAFQRAKCILHKACLLFPSNSGHEIEPRYAYSQKSCLDAALQILDLQAVLDQETQAGGRLFAYREKALLLVKTDFLLASMILCSYLDQGREASQLSDMNTTIIATLQRTRVIWSKSCSSSSEARKIATTLQTVLDRRNLSGSIETLSDVPSASGSRTSLQHGMNIDILTPEATEITSTQTASLQAGASKDEIWWDFTHDPSVAWALE